MAVKTYKPGLLAACRILLAFINRNEEKLRQNLGESGYTILVSVVEAVESMVDFLVDDIPPADT